MSDSDGHLARPGQPVLPPFSTRTLHHPSFLPLYVAAGFAHRRRDCNNPTVHPLMPAEVFYTDPTMSRGRRIPNIVSGLGVFDCLQLNTPPPVMSARPAPPNRPDPFRSGPHPTRDLGSPTWRLNPNRSPSRAILQLTQEEDQAITSLLKLRHQEPGQGDEALAAARADSSTGADVNPTPAEEVHKSVCSDVPRPRNSGLGNRLQQTGWSDVELEAADTLLSRFSLTEGDRIWGRRRQKPAATPPDPPPSRHNRDLPISTDTQQESEALPASKATHSTQNDIGFFGFTCVSEYRDFRSVEGRRGSGDFSERREWTLSDSEGDAVRVLLSLGDSGTLDIPQ